MTTEFQPFDGPGTHVKELQFGPGLIDRVIHEWKFIGSCARFSRLIKVETLVRRALISSAPFLYFFPHPSSGDMAEPVGFTASSITLVYFTKEVIEHLKDAYHGKKERDEIFFELTSTQDVLIQVQEIKNQDKLADIMKVLAMPYGPLQRLETALKSLKKGLEP